MSATLLKFFALFFMTLDHIYDYFPGSPLFFKWIGRISAPIFLFLSCESYRHTSKKIIVAQLSRQKSKIFIMN